jgi:hypothetical protein
MSAKAPGSILLAAMLLGAPAAIAGQDPKRVEVSIVFVTELNITQLTIDQDPFIAWVKPILAAVPGQFAKGEMRRDVVIQVTLPTKGKEGAEAELAGRPALSKEEAKALRAALKIEEAPRAKVVPLTFRIVARINGGAPADAGPPRPPLLTPDERRLAAFKKATTPERLALLRRWALEEAVPITAAACAEAEAKYEGVRDLGKAIAALDPARPIDLDALTDRNPDYWRALWEMKGGIPLVPVTRIALLLAVGKVDQARRLAEVASFFDGHKSQGDGILSHVLNRTFSL